MLKEKLILKAPILAFDGNDKLFKIIHAGKEAEFVTMYPEHHDSPQNLNVDGIRYEMYWSKEEYQKCLSL